MLITNNTSKQRILYIDFLKFIGLTGIIIAHVGSPSWLNMVRSFDVPLMVIVSSILGAISFNRYRSKNLLIRDYYFSRIKRLVCPTWIFLLIYFFIHYFASGSLLDLKFYIASFGLTRYGIGYVWIFLIYLYSALLIPLFNKIQLSKIGFLCITVTYILYEILYYFKIGTNNFVIDTTFFYIVPYGILTYLGCNYNKIKKSYRFYIFIVSFVIFIGFGIYYWLSFGTPQPVQIAKYPPRIYYLSFGIAVSFMLILLCENMTFKIYNNKVIQFISKHSMWIYLWHILVLTIYGVLGLPEVWYIKFVVVYFVSIIIVLIVNKVLDKIEEKKSIKIFTYFRG